MTGQSWRWSSPGLHVPQLNSLRQSLQKVKKMQNERLIRAIEIVKKRGQIEYGKTFTVSTGTIVRAGDPAYVRAWIAANESHAAAGLSGRAAYRWDEPESRGLKGGATKPLTNYTREKVDAITHLLKECGPSTSKALTDSLPSNVNASNTLRVMRDKGLVESKRASPNDNYTWSLK